MRQISAAALALLLAAGGLCPAEAAPWAGLPSGGALESSGGGGSNGPSGGGSFGNGGATSGSAAAPKLFPSGGALHWNFQSEAPQSQKTAKAKPIIAAEGGADRDRPTAQTDSG